LKLLAIETSGKACSATVYRDGLYETVFSQNAGTHSSALFPHIENAMQKAGLTPGELDLIAVSRGPGSFTGIRIGIAAAKGIALGCDIPTAGISSLEAAIRPDLPEGRYLSLIDARHQTYYRALFSIGPEGVSRLMPDAILSAEEIIKDIPSDTFLIGEGSSSFASLYPDAGFILSDAVASSEGVMRAALSLKPDEYCSAQALEAVYLRVSQAERTHLTGEKN